MDEATFNRLLSEAKELQTKLDNLTAFVKSNKIKELSAENQFLMEAQMKYMDGYLSILRRRIYINK